MSNERGGKHKHPDVFLGNLVIKNKAHGKNGANAETYQPNGHIAPSVQDHLKGRDYGNDCEQIVEHCLPSPVSPNEAERFFLHAIFDQHSEQATEYVCAACDNPKKRAE
jgi:hypothetical protein